MFPLKINMNDKEYLKVEDILSEDILKDFLIKHPYDIYAIVNETTDEKSEPMLTTFLVLYTNDFENTLILYDVSRERHSTITTELSTLTKGYIEMIYVGIIDRFPIALYARGKD